MIRTEERIELDLGASRWKFLGARAAFHARERVLIVADVHLGKVAAFHARGVPLAPQIAAASTTANLARLSALINQHAPRQLVFLGDLWHAHEALAAATVEHVATWRRQHARLDMVLVEGNHDANAGSPPQALDLRVVQEPWPIANVLLAHVPQWVEGAHVLAGHLHPATHLYGRASNSVRLPCFWVRTRCATTHSSLTVLPAFGEFTGSAAITRESGDRVVVVAEESLFEVPAKSPARASAM